MASAVQLELALPAMLMARFALRVAVTLWTSYLWRWALVLVLVLVLALVSAVWHLVQLGLRLRRRIMAIRPLLAHLQQPLVLGLVVMQQLAVVGTQLAQDSHLRILVLVASAALPGPSVVSACPVAAGHTQAYQGPSPLQRLHLWFRRCRLERFQLHPAPAAALLLCLSVPLSCSLAEARGLLE